MAMLDLSEVVKAPPHEVFAVMSDFPNCSKYCSQIKRVEMLTEGPIGKGTRFRETRVMFGRESTEEMMVADFDPPRSYTITGESCGARFVTVMSVEPDDQGSRIRMTMDWKPITGFAKVMSALTGWLMMGTCRKMVQRELADISRHVEGRHNGHA